MGPRATTIAIFAVGAVAVLAWMQANEVARYVSGKGAPASSGTFTL